MASDAVFDLSKLPVHLGLGARVLRQPELGAASWFDSYAERTASDGAEGRLVTVHSFSQPWDTWEMHPEGDELVVCLAGRIVLHQEIDGALLTMTLEPQQALVNPAGVWHTADVSSEATALFITAGVGSENRPR